jgi:hypothetical protein
LGQTLGSIGGETRDSSGAIATQVAVTVVNPGTNAKAARIDIELQVGQASARQGGVCPAEFGREATWPNITLVQDGRLGNSLVHRDNRFDRHTTYPNFGLLVLVDDGANGNYNSMASQLTKRFSHGVTGYFQAFFRLVAYPGTVS